MNGRTKRRLSLLGARFTHDRSGVAATEFAVIVPIMLVSFFGVVEITSGIAAYRKVSVTAHAISDLTSQSSSLQDADLNNFFAASATIMAPFVTPAVKQTVAQLWVNPSLQARVQWAKNSDGTAAVAPGTVVQIPAPLQIANTYIIYSTATYTYVPAVGYVIKPAGVTLTDYSYTRPRQSLCVQYNVAANSPCPQR